jgi:hypothetical protein
MRFTCFDPGQTSEQSRTLENHQRDAKKFKFSSNMAPFLFRQTTISFALDVDEKGVTIYIYMYDGIKEKKISSAFVIKADVIFWKDKKKGEN